MLMVLVANLHKALCNFQYHVSMNSRSLFNYIFWCLRDHLSCCTIQRKKIECLWFNDEVSSSIKLHADLWQCFAHAPNKSSSKLHANVHKATLNPFYNEMSLLNKFALELLRCCLLIQILFYSPYPVTSKNASLMESFWNERHFKVKFNSSIKSGSLKIAADAVKTQRDLAARGEYVVKPLSRRFLLCVITCWWMDAMQNQERS